MNGTSLKESIRLQREKLTAMLSENMHELALQCATVFPDKGRLEQLLSDTFPNLTYCKHLYMLDAEGVQITDNITKGGADANHFGRNRMDRPYMQGIIGSTEFKLSEAYISRNKKRPSVTAIRVVRNDEGERLGFLGADFDLRELPIISERYQEPDNWRQIKGDPAIRSSVFLQQRAESLMDAHLDEVIPIMNELITEHGVFHGKLHFSSSRATMRAIMAGTCGFTWSSGSGKAGILRGSPACTWPGAVAGHRGSSPRTSTRCHCRTPTSG